MKAFLIVCLILAAIFALLCTSVVFTFSLGNDGVYRHNIRWLFFRLHALPLVRESVGYSQKNVKRKPEKENKKQKKDKPKPKFKFKGLSAVKEFTDGLIAFLEEVFGGLLKTVRVRRLYVKITVGNADITKTATQYGAISAVLSNALSRLENAVSFHDTYISVEPSFLNEKTYIYLDGKIKIRIISVMAVILKNMFKGLNIYEQAMQTFFEDAPAQSEKGKK